MSTRLRLVSLTVVAALAACGSSGTATTETPTPTPTPTAAVAPPLVGLHAPVAAGQRLVVFNGYDYPLATPEKCPSVRTDAHDHCGSQADALDIIPSDLADPRILAPAGGKVWWRDPDTKAEACLGINTSASDNLTVCHFALGKILVQQGDRVEAGQVLGLRDPNTWWIHINIYDNGAAGKPAIAFDGDYALEGISLPEGDPPQHNRWCGATIDSTTQIPADDKRADQARYTTFAAAPAPACGSATATATPTAAPTPTPTPKPTPTPTPKPTPPPQPTGTTWTFLGYTDQAQTTTMHFRATWQEPKGAATKFLIYGLVPCLRYAEKNDRGPCLVKGMELDGSDLDLLATVPGDKRAAKIAVERPWEAGPDPYESYLIRAVNSVGKSKFTILDPGEVCWQCTPGNNLP